MKFTELKKKLIKKIKYFWFIDLSVITKVIDSLFKYKIYDLPVFCIITSLLIIYLIYKLLKNK